MRENTKTPPGLGHDGRVSHATTVDSNAGIGDGGENRFGVRGEGHTNAPGVGHQEGDAPDEDTVGDDDERDHDPGASGGHNANN